MSSGPADLFAYSPGETTEGRPDLSVVVPLYDEDENVELLYDRLKAALEELRRPYEIVLVDDGSTDATETIIAALAEKDPRVHAIILGRNYGQTAAMSAGFRHAQGKVIVSIDGDLQNDPRDIGKLLEKIEEGYDVASGWRRHRQDRFFTRVIPSRVANWVISRAAHLPLHDYGCTLKAYRRSVIENLRIYGEMHRFIPIYAMWQGARITEVAVTHHPRERGKSKYGLDRTVKVLLDLIVIRFLYHYAQKPIYLYGGFGIVCVATGFLSALASVYYKYLADPAKSFIETPLPLLTVLLFILGINSVLMGLLAEISIRTYHESQNVSPYQIKRVVSRRDTRPADPH